MQRQKHRFTWVREQGKGEKLVFKSKKILALTLVLAVVLTVAGCGPKPAPSEAEEPGEDKIKVGLVFDVGGRGDLSFNDGTYAGFRRL